MHDRILIVGANGHLGHVVVETALENDYRVRAADTKTGSSGCNETFRT